MTGFVVFVIIVVAVGMALGPVRERYARPGTPLGDRLGADVRRDADRRRLLSELKAMADRQSELWERQLDPTGTPERYAAVRRLARPERDQTSGPESVDDTERRAA